MCKAIFVPDGCRLNLPKLLQLFNDIWKVKEPSTLVSADAGTVHPVQFATLNLASLPQFKRCWENALKHAEDAFRRSGQEADDEAKKEMAMSVINDVIFLKLKTEQRNMLTTSFRRWPSKHTLPAACGH